MSRNRALRVLPVLLVAACSGGGSTPATAPTIQALSLTPRALYAAPTPVTLSLGYEFDDPDGDVASATVAVTDDTGTLELRQTIATPAGGVVASQVSVGAVVVMPNVGTFTLTLFVTDATVRRSTARTEPVAGTPHPWTQMSPHPLQLMEAAAVGLDHRLYVLGGTRFDTTPPGPTNIVGAYDPAFDGWFEMAPLPTPR